MKRDAPAANQPSGIEDLTKKIEQLADTFKQDVQKAFDPETIKTNFNNMVDTINKQVLNPWFIFIHSKKNIWSLVIITSSPKYWMTFAIQINLILAFCYII